MWRIWHLTDQPGFNTRNMCERKKFKDSDSEEFFPIDLTWWGDQVCTDNFLVVSVSMK